MKILSNILRTTVIIAAVSVFSTITFSQSGRLQPAPTATPDDTVRVLTEEIKLNVLAFNPQGDFVPDVTNDDLVITENNILHQPESVRRLPAHVLIVMDMGGEMHSVKSLDQTRKVAAGIIHALRPGDSIAIMQFSNKPEMVAEWMTNKEQALAAVKRTNFGIRSAFVDALRSATDFLLNSPIENRHMVLITDGADTFGRSSAKHDTIQRLLSTDISVHVLSYTAMESAELEPRTKTLTDSPRVKAMPDEVASQLPNGARDAAQAPKVGPTINLDRKMIKSVRARQQELELSERQLAELAENTNGEFILPGTADEMVDKTAVVARMIDSSYVVTYVPKIPVVETRGMGERNILVTSKRQGLVVQARRRLVVLRSKP